MKKWLLPFCLLLLAALGAACVRQPATVLDPAPPSLAEETWQRFLQNSARAESVNGPFRLNATVYYSGKEGSQRVTSYLWGNGNTVSPTPLRLDILVGQGNVAASALENNQGLYIYVPQKHRVYHAEDNGLEAFGLPLPFSLADLSLLVTGKFAQLFAPDGQLVAPAYLTKENTLLYETNGGLRPGRVQISSIGLPLRWEEQGKGWQLDLEYWPDSTRQRPRKVYIRHPNGKEATIIVRELNFPPQPFSPEQLELKTAPGTALAPISKLQ